MLFWLYQSLTWLALPLIALGLRVRGEAPDRIAQRLGRLSTAKTGLWFHAASVGELRALAPLLDHFGDQVGLLTLQSQQGLDTAERLFGDRFPVRTAPLDNLGVLKRFLDGFEPTGLVLYENEIFPGWLRALQDRGVGAVLLNLACSRRSEAFWQSNPQLLGALRLITSTEDRPDFPVRVEPALPLKLAGEPLPVDPDLVAAWRQWLGEDDLLIFANAHPEEAEAILVNMVEHAQGKIIIAPRHPDKIKLFQQAIGEETDRMRYWLGFGTLGSLYALGGTVALGGSFKAKSGAHSPMEALRAGRPVVVGPHEGKQASLLALLDAKGLITRWPAKPASAAAAVDASVVDDLAQQALDQAIAAIKSLNP